MIQHFINIMIGLLMALIMIFVLGIVMFQFDTFYGLVIMYIAGINILEMFIIYFVLLYLDNRNYSEQIVTV